MSNSVRGYLLILNVEEEREGSKVDVERLSEVFEKMGADVDKRSNPTRNDIKNTMREMKVKDFSNYLYVAVAYMCHGFEDDLTMTTDREVINAEKSILIPLGNNKSLNGKLKWLIMQCCRGSYDFVKLKSEGPSSLIPYPDYFAKFFATTEKMKAYRHTQRGSYFIQALCRRLEKHYKDLDIISIMHEISHDVQNETRKIYKSSKIVQVPAYNENFDGKIFFVSRGFEDEN